MSALRRAVRRTGPHRILFVVPDLRTGGAERHVATLAPALDPHRFDVSLVCVGEEGALFEGLRARGVSVRALRSRRHRVRALLALIGVMARTRPDIVITRGYNADTLGRLAAMVTRVPRRVVWMHNASDIAPRGPVRRLVYRLLDHITSAYYGVADEQRHYLVDQLGWSPGKIEIIENGVDPLEFRPAGPAGRDHAAHALGLAAGPPTIGMVAVLRPEKDHHTALEAMRLVTDEIPDARLVLIGDGPLRPELERRAADLGIADRVVFAGARSDVASLFALLDVVLLSSTTECFPLSVLEAMASGRPVVATAVGGLPDMIEDGETGRLVTPGDPRSMAEAVIKLLRDREGTAAMGVASRRRAVERFTLERSVAVAEQTLLRTLGVHGAGVPVRLTIVQDEVDTAGGAENLLLALCRHLDRTVVEPRLVCLRRVGEMGSAFEAAGVPVELVGRRGRFDPTTVLRLVRSFRATRTDVVLLTHHQRAALVLGRIAAKAARVPANVVAAHDMGLTRVGKRVLPRGVVGTLALSDALVLLAPSQGRYLREEEGVGGFPWSRTREVVIPNGIEIPPAPTPRDRAEGRALLELAEDDLVVGIVAILREQKAHHVLLRAIAQLAPTLPELRLVVVGEGPEGPRIRALARELGIDDRVVFTGLRHDVARLLPAFDVSCLSSVHEGAPLVVLESMAAGVPMVVTDCGALRDLVSDSVDGYVVPVGDDDALAARIAELAADPERRRAMGSRARARALRDFSLDRTVRGYEELIMGLVSR